MSYEYPFGVILAFVGMPFMAAAVIWMGYLIYQHEKIMKQKENSK